MKTVIGFACCDAPGHPVVIASRGQRHVLTPYKDGADAARFLRSATRGLSVENHGDVEKQVSVVVGRVAGKRKKTTRKKAARKKAARKKAARKKTTRKKAARKKTTRKKAPRARP